MSDAERDGTHETRRVVHDGPGHYAGDAAYCGGCLRDQEAREAHATGDTADRDALAWRAASWAGWCTDNDVTLPKLAELCGFLIEVKRALLDGPAAGHNDREELAAIAKHVIDVEVMYDEDDWHLFADAVLAAGFRRTPETEAAEITHEAPMRGSGVTPCCKRPPSELPSRDRMTTDLSLVTCLGREGSE